MSNNEPNHAPLIVICITFLTTVFGCLGAWCIVRGYQAGEILTTVAGGGLGGLVGFLGGKPVSTNSATPTMTAVPPAAQPTGNTP
jgi:hypothetical protein